jgi:hypothetical protein
MNQISHYRTLKYRNPSKFNKKLDIYIGTQIDVIKPENDVDNLKLTKGVLQ